MKNAIENEIYGSQYILDRYNGSKHDDERYGEIDNG